MLIDNIVFLKENSPILYEELKKSEENTNESKVILEDTKTSDKTLKIEKDNSMIYLHSKYNPLREAESIIDNLEERESIDEDKYIIFYGLGLGYHIDAFASRYPNVEFSVYEPSIEVFRHFLEYNNLKSNSYRKLDLVQCEYESKIMEDFFSNIIKKIDKKLIIMDLPSYSSAFKENHETFLRRFKEVLTNERKSLHTDYAFQKRWIINSMKNLKEVLSTPNIILEKKGEFKGKTAVLAAAGPSLNDEIENLRYIKDNGLAYIFSVGSAINTLIYNNIYPDAACTYDPTIKNQIVFEKINLEPLFKTILEKVPAPKGDFEGPLQILVSSIDYDEYTGRTAIGRIERGKIRWGQQAVVCKKDGTTQDVKLSKVFKFDGLKKIDCPEALLGDIVAIPGLEGINIGETICDVDFPEPLPFVDIDEPTVSMTFLVNNSPFAGYEGTYVTSRHLRDRLFKELENDVSLRVEETDTPDAFNVSGRGELHLSILIETMRRQGYEFQVSKPRVIMKEIEGILNEPIEYLTIDVHEDYMGVVMEKLGPRKAEMLNMQSANEGYMRIEFKIPARGLIGYRSEFMTDTKGNGIMNHIFYGYEPYKGDLQTRPRGSIIAWEQGESITYGLYNAQERGTLFIGPGIKVYEGMVVGENARPEDIVVNVCKKKHVTNMRASGSDDALRLTPPKILSLEQSLEFISDDELVEVTPKTIRLRKKILNTEQRAKAKNSKESRT